jgi:hypothetical protein
MMSPLSVSVRWMSTRTRIGCRKKPARAIGCPALLNGAMRRKSRRVSSVEVQTCMIVEDAMTAWDLHRRPVDLRPIRWE